MKKLDIKRALLEHHMTQVELAQKSGIIAPNISAIIKGGNPTVAKLIQIAEGIGCDIYNPQNEMFSHFGTKR